MKLRSAHRVTASQAPWCTVWLHTQHSLFFLKGKKEHFTGVYYLQQGINVPNTYPALVRAILTSFSEKVPN